MTNYVFEMQDGTILSQSFDDEAVKSGQALSNYYSRCSFAAMSSVVHHTIMLIDEVGNTLQCAHFYHEPVSQEEEE